MNKKELLNFTKFLLNSYKAGLTNINIANSLVSSSKYKKIGLIIQKEISQNKLPLSIALRKNNLVPTYFTYILEAAEKSGQIQEILKSYQEILENEIKLENELKSYKTYLLYINILIIFSILFFHFIVNNIVFKIVENKNSQLFQLIQIIHNLLSLPNISIIIFLLILFSISLTFRNFLLDLYEYYILGKPYREITFSQIMNVWGNLINTGIPINLSLYISITVLQNEFFKQKLNAIFSKITDNYKKIDNQILSQIIDIFPENYRLTLKNSFITGNIGDTLIESSRDLYENSSKSLKSRLTIILSTIVAIFIIFLAFIIIISFMSIYLPFMEEVN